MLWAPFFRMPELSQPNEELEGLGVWTYSLARMPGNIWLHGVANKGAKGRITVDKSLGHVFLKGFLAERSDNAIRDKIRPHLNAILTLPLGEALAYKATLKDLISRLNDLSQLSL